jgi:hypothetical protein
MQQDNPMNHASDIQAHKYAQEAPAGRLLESVLQLTRQILDCVRAERFQDVSDLFAKRMILIEELKVGGYREHRQETLEHRETIRDLMDTNQCIARELETKKKRVSDKLRVLRQKKMLERYSH